MSTIVAVTPRWSRLAVAFVAMAACIVSMGVAQTAPRFEISYSALLNAGPITGRLLVLLTKKEHPEPRLTVSPQGPAIFAIDVDQWRAGQPVTLDTRNALGYPKPLAETPTGDYFVQAIVNVYTQARRSDGHTIWVHFHDSGWLDSFNTAPGNLYSEVQPIKIGQTDPLTIDITRVISPHKPLTDTDWVKRVRIQSQKLTAFWGHPMFVNATALLPKGYADHPDVSYPTAYTMIHNVPFSFGTDNGRATPDRERQLQAMGLQSPHDFYQSWISDRFPRFIAVSFQQPTPYFPDSYSVNSVNQGPYGDAIIEEIIPALEKQFRMIPKPYARQIEGASTGGWQTLALQLFHPDFFGGAWVLQPDPIDFRHYQLTNIYDDDNAFVLTTGPFTTAERAFKRTVNGQAVWTTRQMSLFEEVLGTRGRSGYQLEGWEAIYGPIDAEGYPVPLWNKLTGKINHDVAHYMREHGYDLRAYAEKNWPTLGPRLVGKLHFFCGDVDDFYLNLAVYDFEEFLKKSETPHYEAEFTYGRPMKGHAWHAFNWAEYVRKMAEHVKRNAPEGENTASWNY